MAQDLLTKYAGLIGEFDPHSESEYERQERAGLIGFLADEKLTDEGLEKLLEVYASKSKDGAGLFACINDPVYHWVFYIAEYKRKGTIHSGLTKEEIVARVKAGRKALKEKQTEKVAE